MSEALFAVNQKVMARHEGVFRNAQIERAEEFVGSDSQLQRRYYVHWFDFDRRLDQWVPETDIVNMPASASTKAAKAKTKGTQVVTRQMAQRGGTQEDPTATPPPPPKGAAARESGRRGTGDSKFFYLPKNVERVYMGRWDIPVWYFSPYLVARQAVRAGLESVSDRLSVSGSAPLNVRSSPIAPELLSAGNCWDRILHLCPFCCAPFLFDGDMRHHVQSGLGCERRPPGREVYRDSKNNLIVFEVDGVEQRVFGQNLALLSKLFLEHKYVDYDMSPFVFYVLCIIQDEGCEVAAYFSREKRSPDNYNLSCILSLPQYQRRGYARFLVEMSYEMTKREGRGRGGTPERPLSDLGERLYYAYWSDAVLDVIVHHRLHSGGCLSPLTIETITAETGLTREDILFTLKHLKIMDKNSDVHISDQAAKAHEQARLQTAASDRVQFWPTFLCWNPRQYQLTSAPKEGGDVVVANRALASESLSTTRKRGRA